MPISRSRADCRARSTGRRRAAVRRCRSSRSRPASGARANLPDEEIALFRRRVRETRHPSGRRAQQLPDQRGRRRSTRCGASRSRRLREELDRAETLGLDGLVMHPGSFTTGTEADGLDADCRGPRGGAGVTSRRADAAAARAHGRPGHEPRPPVRASRGDHRHARRLAARRRVPRHVPPADRGIRHLLGGRAIAQTFRAFGAIVGLLATEGVPPERLEEAVRQPRRSARAHRQRLPRARAVPAHPQRFAVRRAADAARDAQSSTPPRAGGAATSIRSTAANLAILRRLIASVAEDVRLEAKDLGAVPPGILVEAGLPAGVRQELDRASIPTRARPAAAADRDACRARRRARVGQRRWRRGRSGSIDSRGPSTDTSTSRSASSGTAHRSEARIFARRARGAPRHLLCQRPPALEGPEAAAKLAAALQRDECAGGARADRSPQWPAAERRSPPRGPPRARAREWPAAARSVNIEKIPACAGQIPDDPAVVAGDFSRMRVSQHACAPVPRAPCAAIMTAMIAPPPHAT